MWYNFVRLLLSYCSLCDNCCYASPLVSTLISAFTFFKYTQRSIQSCHELASHDCFYNDYCYCYCFKIQYLPFEIQIGSTETTFKLGCFMEDTDSDLPYVELRSYLTVEWCIRRCKTLGYRYAGLHKRNQCHCGNSFGKYGTATPRTCILPCPGNTSQTCGGDWRMEIYFRLVMTITHKKS